MRDVLSDELLASCVHCGLCLDTCPTYAETGLESQSPRGRLHFLKGVAEGRWKLEARTQKTVDDCLGCLACESACPSGVPYGRILEWSRGQASRHPRSRLERWLVRHVLWRGALLEWMAALYRRLGGRFFLKLLLPLGGRTGRALVPLVPELESPLESQPATGAASPSVIVFRGCVARAMFPQTEQAMIRLLTLGGYEVQVQETVSCCGALAAHVGEQPLAQDLADKVAASCSPSTAWVVFPAAGCGAHLQHLSRWVSPHRQEEAREIESRVRDVSELLVEAPRALRFRSQERRVAFQDPCHLQHGMGITEAPRELLRRTGAEIVESREKELCCGSAGSYNMANPSMASALGRRKAQRLRETEADTVLSANPGCILQLRAYLPRTIRVLSLVQYLNQHVES